MISLKCKIIMFANENTWSAVATSSISWQAAEICNATHSLHQIYTFSPNVAATKLQGQPQFPLVSYQHHFHTLSYCSCSCEFYQATDNNCVNYCMIKPHPLPYTFIPTPTINLNYYQQL